MEVQPRYSAIVRALDHAGQPYEILPLAGESVLLVLQRGGRLVGPFIDPNSPSLLWTNPSLGNPADYANFLGEGAWNQGGERVYIGPELQYSVPDRTRFWETYTLSSQVDPGNYVLRADSTAGSCVLSQELRMQVYPDGGTKDLELRRVISSAPEPLRQTHLRSLVQETVFTGFDHTVEITERTNDGVTTHIWDLMQVPVGGELIVPTAGRAQYTDYYHPVDDSYHTIDANHVRVQLKGRLRFKVGYKAAHIYGRVGYFRRMDDGQASLVVRSFFSNPSSEYLDEPFAQPGECGDALQFYQDDGSLGDFGEIEVIGQAIGGSTGLSSWRDRLVTWCYVGPPDAVTEICKALIGTTPRSK